MGEHPPEKFVNDISCCVAAQVLVAAGASVCAFIASQADDGGESNIPFFITGFILAPIHVINAMSKIAVIWLVKMKRLSKKNIVEALKSNIAGKWIWPLSCLLGILWCIPGTVLTVFGGVTCDTSASDGRNSTLNTCYYDSDGDRANIYKVLAIVLTSLHIFSFIFFIVSSCPQKLVHDDIMDDPRSRQGRRRPTLVSPVDTNGNITGRTSTSTDTNGQFVHTRRSVDIAGAVNNNTSSNSGVHVIDMRNAGGVNNNQTGAMTSTANPNVTSSNRSEDPDLNSLRALELQVISRQLAVRERELERREAQLNQRPTQELPPPPAYDVVVSGLASTVTSDNNASQLPPTDNQIRL